MIGKSYVILLNETLKWRREKEITHKKKEIIYPTALPESIWFTIDNHQTNRFYIFIRNKLFVWFAFELRSSEMLKKNSTKHSVRYLTVNSVLVPVQRTIKEEKKYTSKRIVVMKSHAFPFALGNTCIITPRFNSSSLSSSLWS